MKQAAIYYQKASEQNLAVAETNLALMYQNGIGVDKDYRKAYELHLKAAQDGDPNGYANIGNMYLSGLFVNKDIDKALEYFNKAADLGNYSGLTNLAIMYQTGNGVPLDGNKAVSYYERARKIDHTGAADYNLGVLYYSGCGSVRQDYSKAFEHFENSAKKGYAPAKYNMGIMYLKGQYVRQSESSAIIYIEEAAEQKFQPAVEYMKKLNRAKMNNGLNRFGNSRHLW
jgi:hypothetical protein